MTTITKVTVDELRKKDGTFKAYRYDAHVAAPEESRGWNLDATPTRLRTSKRLYPFAFQYESKVQGNASPGLSQYFCFGKRPPQGLGTPIKTFRIEEG